MDQSGLHMPMPQQLDKLLHRACEVAPYLIQDGSTVSDTLTHDQIVFIQGVLTQAHGMTEEEISAEQEAIKSLPEYQKSATLQNYAKKLSRFNPKKNSIGVDAVYDKDERPILDKDKATDFLGKFWGEKMKATNIESEKAQEFVAEFSNPFPRIEWQLSLIQFVVLLSCLKMSAPGPDGIPYRLWAICPDTIVCVFSSYLVWLFSQKVPCFFNVSYLWLLPKCCPQSGIFHPSETRPLSGSNTDYKIFAMALGTCFNRVLGDWAISCQAGFIRGRVMIGHVARLATIEKGACYTISCSENIKMPRRQIQSIEE